MATMAPSRSAVRDDPFSRSVRTTTTMDRSRGAFGDESAQLLRGHWSGASGAFGLRYQVVERFAVGGMAEIYLARAFGPEGFENHVVLKRLLPAHAADPSLVRTFVDEARVAGRLQHENIVQMNDVGLVDGVYFLVMEYLHGRDAEAVFEAATREGGAVPLAPALHIAGKIAAALHYAHEVASSDGAPWNLVHRDVSPANIIVTHDGGVKLVDFGAAKATVSWEHTQLGFVKGKAPYMSPEQCVRAPLDRRSDVFSLGVVLYELSTGRTPFRWPGATNSAIMEKIISGRCEPPTSLVADYPRQLERVVMRALEPICTRRQQTARELGLAIEEVAMDLGLDMSRAALSAYMRSLFGEQPERWRSAPDQPYALARPAAATVTDEPTVSAPPGAAPVADEPTQVEEAAVVFARFAVAPRHEDGAGDVTAVYGAEQQRVAAVPPLAGPTQLLHDHDVTVWVAVESAPSNPRSSLWWAHIALALICTVGLIAIAVCTVI